MRLGLAARAALLVPVVLNAQSPERDARSRSAAQWILAWSPLTAIADHSRRLPTAPPLPDLLTAPAPRIGLLWTVGNPAGLRTEASDRRSELRIGTSKENGSYRRPLDPDAAAVRGIAALAWQGVGRNGAAIGRAVVEEEEHDPGSFADIAEPFGSSPLVVTDTSRPAMRRVRARLEGAAGWRWGGWGGGLAVGYEARDHRTRSARFPRFGRVSTPGVTVGASREVAAGVKLALHGRWTGGYETVTLIPLPGVGTVYQLEGYSEPDRRDVVQVPGYYRRIERNTRAFGISANGRQFGTAWTAFGETTRRRESHSSERRENPPEDRWIADGSAFGAAAQRSLFAGRVLLTAQGGYSILDGDATRADLDGAIFRADESVLTGSVDARYATRDSAWLVGVIVTGARERRFRRDFIAEVRSFVESFSPGISLEVARSLGHSTAVAAGFAISQYSAVSRLPNPEALGPVYRTTVAPELSLYATRANPWSVAATLRRRIRASSTAWLRASRASVSAAENASALSLTPNGQRALWSAVLGVTVQ